MQGPCQMIADEMCDAHPQVARWVTPFTATSLERAGASRSPPPPSRLKAIRLIVLFIFIACVKRCWGQGWHMAPRSLLPRQRSSLISNGYWQRARLPHQIPQAALPPVGIEVDRLKITAEVSASFRSFPDVSSRRRIFMIQFACTHVCDDDTFPRCFLKASPLTQWHMVADS